MLQSHRNVNGHRAIGKASNKPSDQRPLPDFADDTLHRPDGIPLFGHESSMNIFQSHFLNASIWCPCFLSRNYDKESVWKSISNHLLPFPLPPPVMLWSPQAASQPSGTGLAPSGCYWGCAHCWGCAGACAQAPEKAVAEGGRGFQLQGRGKTGALAGMEAKEM